MKGDIIYHNMKTEKVTSQEAMWLVCMCLYEIAQTQTVPRWLITLLRLSLQAKGLAALNY